MKRSIIHIYLYGMLKKKVRNGNIISISDINPIIKWTVRIPCRYQKEFLKELVELEYLKKLGRDNYEIQTIPIKNAPLDSQGAPLW